MSKSQRALSYQSSCGLFEGDIVGVVTTDAGASQACVRSESGDEIFAAVPLGVDVAWLVAAIEVAPVKAVYARLPSDLVVLWALLPQPCHRQVRADIVLRGRRVLIEGEGDVRLSSQQNIDVHGERITSQARGEHVVRGAVIRLN